VAGRAKLWLTFDEIHTKFGSLPIVAEVATVPGDHNVKSSVASRAGAAREKRRRQARRLAP